MCKREFTLRFILLYLYAAVVGNDAGAQFQVTEDHPVANRQAFSLESSVFRYKFKNNSNQPIVIVAPTETSECEVSDFEKRPILPGREATIKITCRWHSFGGREGYRRTPVRIGIAPKGEIVLNPSAMIYRPDAYTRDQDSCVARKKLNCTNGVRKIRRLCVNGLGSKGFEPKAKAVLNEFFCSGSTFERLSVKTADDLTKKLNDILENSCDMIEAIAINGHGKSGTQATNEDSISLHNVEQIFQSGKYECLLTQKSRLLFGGCNVGNGCIGRLFLLAAGDALAPKQKEVVVMAASTYSSSLVQGGISRTGSVNGSDLVLTKRGKDFEFRFDGLVTKNAKTIPQSCASECESREAQLLAADKVLTTCKDKKNKSFFQQISGLGHQFLRKCASYKDSNISTAEFFQGLGITSPRLMKESMYSAYNDDTLLMIKELCACSSSPNAF